MKNTHWFLGFITVFIGISVISYAQVPQLINYQAVARNAAGQPLANQAVSVRLSVRQSTAGGTIQYQETHNVTSGPQALINLQIGGGSPNLDSFADITWTDGQPKFLQTELDPDGPGAQPFVNMGTQQLVSVPYALYGEETRWVKVSGENMRVGDSNYNFSGDKNVAIGKQALSANTTASQNSALGFNALLNNNGFGNTAVGSKALFSNGAGAVNSAVGYNALYNNTEGSDNTAAGANAMFSNSLGGLNSAFGENSLYNNINP
ncbi:hypothetical protein C7N43_20395 [Sphingobacteriales bacterium UPWRP_1]|nr:hypothetical protein BVG80_02360 [Sphingobacteriales bacterium TSM_CSM]PSJ75181.1 hypothetical protein C7N43_20395 [Sphingobacteriales bacterium UPWRP_1]